ncbi:MAG: hypothetical protein NkDv07_0400 [Candidatus Improbicoccus devescovinae]|nr:MAG: hypothetical protein NkDv07_0400 [Candidatus Improbicoccus devescovinae]
MKNNESYSKHEIKIINILKKISQNEDILSEFLKLDSYDRYKFCINMNLPELESQFSYDEFNNFISKNQKKASILSDKILENVNAGGLIGDVIGLTLLGGVCFLVFVNREKVKGMLH